MTAQLILMVIALYFLLLIVLSWITSRKNTGNEAFFLGNRQSPWYIVAIGMIGSSLSGVSFVSVPGMVTSIDMTYMQMVLGFIFGYVVIAKVLLPLYYKLRLTSIYEYLNIRFGQRSYKTGAVFFLLSKLLGAAARFYLVVMILQKYVFEQWGIPFIANVLISILMVWLYTFRSGIRTIIWTDTLQALCLVGMLTLIILKVKNHLQLDTVGMWQIIAESPYSRIFEFEDWSSRQHFLKQFISGVFIPIVMTGLDQDMMQKNLTCRNLNESKKNMYVYGIAFTPINFMFLSLGILLTTLAAQTNFALPNAGDDILPTICTSGLLGNSIVVFFTIGIIAASFSSADSALAALTTSFCIDILDIKKDNAAKSRKTRLYTHVAISATFIITILSFKYLNNRSIIDAIYTIASYTYGPLLGLFAFGLFTKRKADDKYVPLICFSAPLICLVLQHWTAKHTGYHFGYELLLVNGVITFGGLCYKRKHKSNPTF